MSYGKFLGAVLHENEISLTGRRNDLKALCHYLLLSLLSRFDILRNCGENNVSLSEQSESAYLNDLYSLTAHPRCMRSRIGRSLDGAEEFNRRNPRQSAFSLRQSHTEPRPQQHINNIPASTALSYGMARRTHDR